MSDIQQEELYLQQVMQLIDEKMQELDGKVDIADKDMADFHEYFWNSYTEFDEYGYELFDNTNAIRQKIQQKGEYIRAKYIYERMKDSPYFGRVDFLYDGELETTPCYIGISNLSKNAAELPLVYDWRAPVSSLFYDYDSGPAEYEAPAGVITGKITDKYQYKIQNGRIIYMLQSDMNIDDDILKKELGTHASASLKAIVSTIQKEQNLIIRDTEHRIVAVQGCAGSGKTSVALHRIAYLLYHNRHSLKASQVLILSPNGVFADYISRILPELGEENICEMSLDVWAYHKLKKVGELQDRYDRMEELLGCRKHDHSTREADYKQSIEYVQELDGYILGLESEGVDFRDFKHRGHLYKAEYIEKLFYDKLWNIPILERMERVAEFIIDEEETLLGRDISAEERQSIIDSLNEMYVQRDLIAIYNDFLEQSGRRPLKAQLTGVVRPEDYDATSDEDNNGIDEYGVPKPPKADKGWLRADLIPYEDVYPILYLKYSLYFNQEERPVKHLIIDEMQDYTYLQYRLIEKLFHCAMTILGDKAQTMEEKQRDVLEFLPSVFGKDLYRVELNKSYRSTREITEFAASILGLDTVSSIDRHGEAVSEQSYASEEECIEALVKALNDMSCYCDTIAVLTTCADRAKEIHTYLAEEDIGTELSLLTADTSVFKRGISVAPFYLTKGLEFDGVCIIDEAMPSEDLHKQAMYVAATRALHKLDIYRIN